MMRHDLVIVVRYLFSLCQSQHFYGLKLHCLIYITLSLRKNSRLAYQNIILIQVHFITYFSATRDVSNSKKWNM